VEGSTSAMQVWSARPKQPYPGLRPFQPDEWSIFFGRETIIDDVIERLATQRVVLIHGASGSGKSSLVLAGVMPRLARQHLRHGVSWITCAMRPSGGPLWNLAREFARIEGSEDDLDRIGHIIRLFNKRDATLGNVVNSLRGLEGKRLCILVDQFEELFRFERETSREEAELFVQLLIGEIATAADDDPDTPTALAGSGKADIHIAITMRSEFLGECARFDGFAEAINRTQYLVPRMRYEALLRAIQRPAELYGGEVTVELARRLVADVRGREDELPLIQHGLMLLWNAAANASKQPVILDVEQFEYAGGLTKLLSDHADRVMASASPSGGSSIAVERLFRALTDINSEGQAIRRPQSFQELVALSEVPADDLRRVLDAFRAEGVSLLTPYFPAAIKDKTVIDISHEALIRCWDRIAAPQNGWLRSEFQNGLIWRSLLNDAREFEIDPKHILSPAATLQRIKWFAERNPSWSERYGGGWDIVAKLLRASRRSDLRSTRVRRLLL
jgi:energy-coupling factor transporter ATP-binding protein EcfA2